MPRERTNSAVLRARQKLGKYIIERKLGEGGFALVFQARDTIEGVRVALKIPYPNLLTSETLEDFRREVRLAARLRCRAMRISRRGMEDRTPRRSKSRVSWTRIL